MKQDIASNLSVSVPEADVPPIKCSTPMSEPTTSVLVGVPIPETTTTADKIKNLNTLYHSLRSICYLLPIIFHDGIDSFFL